MQRLTAAAASSVLAASVTAMLAAGGFGAASALSNVARGARGQVTQVDTTADGTSGNGSTGWTPEFSPDGSRVLFQSDANLVPGDTNGVGDIFVKTLATGAVTRVSTTSTGQQADRSSSESAWSPDGSRIAFSSDAHNLVPGDTNKVSDIFVKNLATGATTRVSTTSTGQQAITDPAVRFAYRTGSTQPAWSPSGRRIAFTSDAYNLVAHDTNAGHWATDVFVKNLRTGKVERVSTSRRGRQANGSSGGPQWSPNGKRVMFSSEATNLVRKCRKGGIFIKTIASGAIKRVASGYDAVFAPNGKRIAYADKRGLTRGDKQRYRNVYVKQLRTGQERRLSNAVRGDPAEVGAYDPAWSPDGRGVAFTSEGTIRIRGLDYEYYPVLVLKKLKSGRVTLLSTKANGKPIVGWSETVGWSPNGKRIVFRSWADNIPPEDFPGSGNFHVYVKTLP